MFCLFLHFPVQFKESVTVDGRIPGNVGADIIVLQVAQQHSGSTEDRCNRWNHKHGNLQFPADLTGMNGACPSGTDQQEFPGIEAAFHRYMPHSLGHIHVNYTIHPGCGLLCIQSQGVSQAGGRYFGGLFFVEFVFTPGKIIRVQIAQDQVGIRTGRLCSSTIVRNRSRKGTCALGPHLQQASLVDPSDASSTGANGDDVECGKGNPVPVYLPFRAGDALTVYHQGSIKAGTSHIHGDAMVKTQQAGIVGARYGRRGRPRQNSHGCNLPGYFRGDHSSVRLHDHQLAPETDLFQFLQQGFQVPADHNPDVGVDAGGAYPFIKTDGGKHFKRGTDKKMGQRIPEIMGRLLFMFIVQVGVHQAHRHGFHFFGFDPGYDRIQFVQVNSNQWVASGIHPLIQAEPQISWHQGFDIPVMVVVPFFPYPSAHLQSIPETFRGDQRGLRSFHGQQGVGGHGSAVDNRVYFFDERGGG